MMFLYYRFVATYHTRPIDLDEFFDGMRNLSAENKINELSFKKD